MDQADWETDVHDIPGAKAGASGNARLPDGENNGSHRGRYFRVSK
jgi:hypothetical protein